MPKWLGMAIHYATLKRVLTSRDGWVFTWGGDRKTDRMLVLSPPQQKCCSCKTQEKLHADLVRRESIARARLRTNTYPATGEVAIVDSNVEVVVVPEDRAPVDG